MPGVYKQKWAPVDHYIVDKYASINGAIIYMSMSITCRPDITFAIGKASRGMHQPTPAHVAALKHLISYMWKTRDFKFRYFSSGCNVRSHLRGITAQSLDVPRARRAESATRRAESAARCAERVARRAKSAARRA